jgi:chromosomal replication initiation ATPase DnaA
MTFHFSLVFHAPKPIKLGSKWSSTRSRGSVKHSKKSKNPKKIKYLKYLKIFKNIAKLSAIALETAFSLKSYISNKFGQANKTFYRKTFHLNSKIRTSKSGVRSELRRLGSEISPNYTFSSFLEGKFKKLRATLQNNVASSTMCLVETSPPPTNNTGSTK